MAKSHKLERHHFTSVRTRNPLTPYTIVNMSQRGPGGATRQAAALRREGVAVGNGHLGELTVDLGTYGWFPSLLPSEEAEDSESEEEAQRLRTGC